MNEFDEFISCLAVDLYEMERDKKRMEDFLISAKRQYTRSYNELNKELEKLDGDENKIRRLEKKFAVNKKYKKNLEKEVRKVTRRINKVSKFVEESKKIKLIVMAYRVGGGECQCTSSSAPSVKGKSKKFSTRTKKKKSK